MAEVSAIAKPVRAFAKRCIPTGQTVVCRCAHTLAALSDPQQYGS